MGAERMGQSKVAMPNGHGIVRGGGWGMVALSMPCRAVHRVENVET